MQILKDPTILGENRDFPANDCYYIRKSYPHKRSGFYWIKNDCFPETLKMYCDFVPNSDEVFDYFIVYDQDKESKKLNDLYYLVSLVELIILSKIFIR